jgi:hypothetical protein
VATRGFRSPCLDPSALHANTLPPFIRVSKYQGIAKVTFAVEMEFDLVTGKTPQWQRVSID